MAVSALELLQRKEDTGLGLFCLALVVSKCIYEIITGHVLFTFLQFGMCGSPLVACHAGGVTGGILAFFGIKWLSQRKKSVKEWVKR